MLDVTIRPEELYFLGELMHAQYINYAYIAAMSDISQAYVAEKASAIRELGKRGLISETLRGGIRVSTELQKLLQPVFFAKRENTLHILTLKPEQSVEVLRFHVLDGNMTMVRMDQKKMQLTAVTEADIREILSSMALYHAAERVIYVSSSCIAVGVQKQTYLLQEGRCYGADASGKSVNVPENVMMEQIISVLKEA